MIGYLGFDDALRRLLAVAYGERALETVSIYRAPDGELHLGFVAPDGELHMGPPELPPDLFLTEDERQAAFSALLWSLRAGDNVGFVEIDGKLERLPLLNWFAPAYWAVPPPDTRPDRDEVGRSILIDEDRFEAWLSMSNALEILRSRSEERVDARPEEANSRLPAVADLIACLNEVLSTNEPVAQSPDAIEAVEPLASERPGKVQAKKRCSDKKLRDWFRTNDNVLLPYRKGWDAAQRELGSEISRDRFCARRKEVAAERNVRLGPGRRKK